MSIATEKLKRSSARWMLIRINPARYISDTLASAGSGVYTLSFNFPISSVERNGVALTETALNPPLSNDNYYYDSSTSTFKVKLASAPNATSNIIIIKYYILYTTSEGEHWHETPTDTETDLRLWEPRIDSAPQIRQGVSNVVYGVFTVQDTSISINNSDADFTKYLTENDSFSDSNVDVWLCITSNDNARLVYRGKCRNIAVNVSSVDIDIYDAFSRLDQPAYFGDTVNEAFYYKSADSFPDIDPRNHGEVCRMIIGNYSRYRTKHGFPDISLYGSEILIGDSMPQAFCTEFSRDITTSNNRDWGLCRLLHDGSGNNAIRSVGWGTVYSELSSGELTILNFDTTVFLTMDVVVGDSVRLTEGGTDHWGIVDKIDTIGPSFYQVFIRTNATSTPVYTSAVTVVSYPAVAVIIVDELGAEHRPIYNKHYTLSYTTTSGGNKFASISFVNNFEGDSYFTALGTLDPGKHKVYFRVRPNTVQIPMHKHGEVMKKISQSAGIDILESTFDTADTELDAGVLMSIPTFQETEYDTYLKYAEDITQSTLAFMFSNTLGQAEYHLLKNASASNTRNHDNILEREINSNIDYRDIYTSVIAYNNNDRADSQSLENSISTAVNQLASRLYNLVRPKQLVHYLDDISGRVDDHLAIFSKPIKTHRISTATLDIDTDINDDLTIESDIIDGGTIDVKVVNTIRDIDKTTIEAIEVSGLSL